MGARMEEAANNAYMQGQKAQEQRSLQALRNYENTVSTDYSNRILPMAEGAMGRALQHGMEVEAKAKATISTMERQVHHTYVNKIQAGTGLKHASRNCDGSNVSDQPSHTNSEQVGRVYLLCESRDSV